MINLNVRDHYWAIGGSTTNVYKSKTNTMVPVSDAEYVAWLPGHGQPIPIGTEAELAVALQSNGYQLPDWLWTAASFIQPSPSTYSKPQLAAYTADARYRRAGGGFTVTSLSPVPFLTDPTSRNTLSNANEYAKVTPHTTDWKMSDGTFIPLSPTQLTTAANAMANFIQACFTCESTTLASINGGTINTIGQIDAAFAAVANVVP
jgi:hypothetical protein